MTTELWCLVVLLTSSSSVSPLQWPSGLSSDRIRSLHQRFSLSQHSPPFLVTAWVSVNKVKPGRVAILVPDKEEVTWGVAYEIRGQQHVRHALEHLYVRENSNGGYHSMLTVFYPRSEQPQPACTDRDSQAKSVDPIVSLSQSRECRSEDVSAPSEPFSVLTFTATPASKLYLGPADMSSMARQVVAAHGQAGPNWEYVLRTAEYVRQHIPEDHDHHLLELEAVVRELMASRRQRHNSVHHDHAAASALLTVPVSV